jgi:hypothetical protein
MIPGRKPDAIRSPLSFAGSGGSYARLTRLQAELAPLLGVPRISVRLQGTEHFITQTPSDTLYFPAQSARAGEPRYDWKDRGDGVHYGYLRADAGTL